MIEYHLSISEPHTHLVEVEVRIPAAEAEVELVMPSWTPGSYLLREFARNVQDFAVHDGSGLRLAWRKVDKNTWRVEAGSGPMLARYRVYANELTVRTSHVDSTHAYLNGASVFMYVRGAEREGARLRIDAPAGWRIATSLHETDTGSFRAADYDELADSPIEIGRHRTIVWDQEGIPHRYAVWGGEEIDEERLIADTRGIVEVCSEMFGGLPYDRYLFLLHVVPGGRGGLEHSTSSSLQVPPAWLSGAEYQSLLALVAHELFHVWLGKRIRPEPLGPFDYTAENYTRNLWVVEGFTTYYTDLILLRAGLITRPRYLERLGDSIARLHALPGRMHQTLEDSSFDAWIRFYRPDSHTPNAQISYYHKGALVALALDLEIRRATSGERSLDDVMRAVWESWRASGRGFPEARERGIRKVVAEIAGEGVANLLDRYVTTVEEIDFDTHLEAAGLALSATAATKPETPADGEPEGPTVAAVPPTKIEPPGAHESRLGMRIREEADAAPKVTHVLAGLPAHAAGINAGDELVAVDGRKATVAEIGRLLQVKEEGDRLELLVSRRGRIVSVCLALEAPTLRRAHLIARSSPTPPQLAVREAWLGRQAPGVTS
ncbi:MAG TPA: PDZ domain-containing protein [Longimicrobiaceae bacterium]|nr:PDZ domain-containing protein [Longimicrobiaceae bacterium]